MYKLLLVDDEEDVREGVTQEIDWTSYGFEVIGKVENGKEALDFIERCVPDVVVTDIKMPFMDGLQLSEEIRKRFPIMKIIILTGFDEFEYAQKAVKLQIDEYVLKPFSAQELIDVLVKVKSQIDEEAAQKENIQLLMEHYQKSLPVLREVFLASLITRKLPQIEIREKAGNYNVHLDGDGFVVSVVSMDQPVEHEGHADRELPLIAVKQIAEEVAQKHQLGIVFHHNDHVVLITVHPNRERDAVLSKTLSALEEIRQTVQTFMKFTVTAGVGAVTNDVTDIAYSYEESVLALDYRVVLGNNRVICIDDVEKRCVETVRFDELKEHALIRCIKVGTVQELQEIVEDLFRGIADAPVSIKDYQIYLLEILTTILKVAKSANLDVDEVFGENFHVFTEIQKFHTLHEAKNWMIGICTKIMNSIASDRQCTYKQLVAQAIEYAKNHYHENDISINKVCSHLHISPGYFSSIFKKETKTTFVNYLMQIRMEAAKELLRTTDLKTFEIAEKVGYSDPNYFSFSFRKMFGISPKEYKNSSRGS